MKLKTVTFAGADEAIKAYDSKRCDAYTTDASGIRSEMRKLVNPDEHVILDDVISKEPLGPAVRQGDDQWFDIVKWVHFAMLAAEEYGVTKANVDEQLRSDVPDIKRLLGTEGKHGEALGLTNDWAFRIIKHVGNYGEVFERNLGQSSPLKLPRGFNALWSKGGLQYAPPIR
jgi:general L-amino acid transport system substrate-binding protein